MAEVFRRLDEIMIVIYYSRDFYDLLPSLMSWCCKGQKIISTQHGAMEHGKKNTAQLQIVLLAA